MCEGVQSSTFSNIWQKILFYLILTGKKKMEAKKETKGCIRWSKLIRNKRKGKKIAHDNSNVLLSFQDFKRCDILGNWCGNPGILFQTSVAEISCCSWLLNTVKALKDGWPSPSKIMMTKSASRKCCWKGRRVTVWKTLDLICSSSKTILPLLQQTKTHQLHPFKHLELQTRRKICKF